MRADIPVYLRIGSQPELLIGTVRGSRLEFTNPAHWKAEALRQAADELYSDDGPGHQLSTATWLRERADRLEAEAS